MNNPILDQSDIINEINPKLKHYECKNIGNKSEDWIKICPSCGNRIKFSSKRNFIRSLKKNSSCCKKRRGPTALIHRQALSVKMKEVRANNPHPLLGKKHKEISKDKMSKSHFGKPRPLVTEDTKRKHRINNLIRLQTLGIGTAIDKGSTEWFSKYNKETSSNFSPKRFWNIGYDADGYDENKHIWIEYDTSYHQMRIHRHRDLIRQKNIINYFENIGEPLVEFKRVLAYKNEELITVYRGYGY